MAENTLSPEQKEVIRKHGIWVQNLRAVTSGLASQNPATIEAQIKHAVNLANALSGAEDAHLTAEFAKVPQTAAAVAALAAAAQPPLTAGEINNKS